jgi:membrane protease YdiL (CAAX protease family)
LTPPEGEPASDPNPDATAPEPPARPGTRTFTIEGRAAPALFVIGWLATLAGGGLLFIAFQAAGTVQSVLLIAALVLLSLGLVTAAGSQGLERRAAGAGPYAGPSPVLVFLASIPASLLGLILLGIPLALLGVPREGPLIAVLSLAVQGLVYWALIRLLVVDTGALSWSQMGIRRPDGSLPRELLAGAIWALPIIFVTGPIALLLTELLDVVPASPLPPTGEPTGIALNLVAGALAAPIGEELFFRAFATTAWVVSLGATRGIVRAGLAFAFVHVLAVEAGGVGEGAALALIGFVSRIPIALALCWLFVRRGTIWAPLALHATFNAILLIAAESQPPVPPV